MKPKPPCSFAASLKQATSRGAERVNRLQTAAADMFLNCGYEGVSVDGLIGRVGGSRRNVWGLYGGKQGLFIAAVRGLCDEITAALAELPMADADARAGLLLYGERLLEMVLQPRMLAMHRLMVSEGQRFPEQARSMCTTGRDNGAAALGQWIAERQARGQLRPERDPRELALRFIDLIVSGPQVRALVGELPPGWTPEGIKAHVATTVDLFLNGAGASASPSPESQASNHTTREHQR